MKRVLFMIITMAATILFVGCEEFTTSYERIEDSEFRMLNFVYEPVDAAPGDTITLRAYFGGKTKYATVNIDDYIKEWWISFNVIVDNIFGGVTVVDSTRLRNIATEERPCFAPDNPSTQCVEFKIPLPDNIMKTSAAFPNDWKGMLTAEQINTLPPALANLPSNKNDIIDMLANFTPDSELADNPFLFLLLQYFTASIQISANVDHGAGRLPHTVRSLHSVRYNTRVATAAPNLRIPINRNPEVEEIIVYTVRGKDVFLFDENAVIDSTVLHFNSDNNEIVINRNHSYFLRAVTSNRDSSRTQFGRWDVERHNSMWQYQVPEDQLTGVSASDYINVMNMDNEHSAFIVPKDSRIENFTLWATVTDEFLNERLRPMGSALAEVRGRFVYE